MATINTIKHFLQKNSIYAAGIKYIIREDNKTNIYMNDDRVISCFHTIKALKEALPEDKFTVIKKGILVSKNQIVEIEKNTYRMLDGRIFDGRKRGLKVHKKLNDSLNRNINLPVAGADDISPAFAILDYMPVPFCVIELIFDNEGKGIDFIFRYCNKKIEELKSIEIDSFVGHSFYEIFPNAEPKWLVSCANVALNGEPCTVTDYNPLIKKNITIHCFQPIEGFCACLILEDNLEEI